MSDSELNQPTCSRLALFQRWHDRSRDKWTAWKEIRGRELFEKFGETVDDWKKYAQGWVDMGGTYEIKIVQLTEHVKWSVHYDQADL